MGDVGVLAVTWALFFPPARPETIGFGGHPLNPGREGIPPLYSPRAVSSYSVDDHQAGWGMKGHRRAEQGLSVEGALGEALLLQVAGVVEADEDGAVAAHVEDADGRQVVAQAAELGDGQP
jgi:hypothetical protein